MANNEVRIKDSTVLITITDKKGRIKYANDAFVTVSGYSRKEIIGKEHNMLQHQDMPTAVFQELWSDIKEFKPWKRLVKFQCKNRGYYWEETHITPLYENASPTGYMWVGYAPSREQIVKAENLYKTGVPGRKSFLRKERGLSRLNIFKRFKIWQKLAIAFLFFAIPGTITVYQAIVTKNVPLLVALVVMVAIAMAFGVWLIRYFNRTLQQMSNTINNLTDGEIRNNIDLQYYDELGGLFRGLQSMQLKLNYDADNAKKKAKNAFSVKQALDNVSANVMVTDVGYDIIYMNKSIRTMFESAQDDIRKVVPVFNTKNLMGENVDCLEQSTDPEKQWLVGLKDTFKSALVVGGQHFDIIANPIITQDGEHNGVVVEWINRTVEVQIVDEIGHIANAIKAGVLSQRVNLVGKTDFVEKLSGEINLLADTIERVFNDIQQVVNAMAEGDLTRKIDNDFTGTFAVCKKSIDEVQKKLAEPLEITSESSECVRNTSQEIISSNKSLSHRTEEQALGRKESTSSIEQLMGTVKISVDNAQQANQVATVARESAQKGSKTANKAVRAMEQINSSSNKIAEAIGVIDEIAFQTNLLALNVVAEAARTGEQGRGFAVVANEVRALAQRSALAAKESKELIKNSLKKVTLGTELINETGEALTEIVGATKKVGDIVTKIASGSEEQSMDINKVDEVVSQKDEITQNSAKPVRHAFEASASVNDQSQHMDSLVTFFKTGEVPMGAERPILGKPLNFSELPAKRFVSPQQVSSAESQNVVADNEDDWGE